MATCARINQICNK